MSDEKKAARIPNIGGARSAVAMYHEGRAHELSPIVVWAYLDGMIEAFDSLLAAYNEVVSSGPRAPAKPPRAYVSNLDGMSVVGSGYGGGYIRVPGRATCEHGAYDPHSTNPADPGAEWCNGPQVASS